MFEELRTFFYDKVSTHKTKYFFLIFQVFSGEITKVYYSKITPKFYKIYIILKNYIKISSKIKYEAKMLTGFFQEFFMAKLIIYRFFQELFFRSAVARNCFDNPKENFFKKIISKPSQKSRNNIEESPQTIWPLNPLHSFKTELRYRFSVQVMYLLMLRFRHSIHEFYPGFPR